MAGSRSLPPALVSWWKTRDGGTLRISRYTVLCLGQIFAALAAWHPHFGKCIWSELGRPPARLPSDPEEAERAERRHT